MLSSLVKSLQDLHIPSIRRIVAQSALLAILLLFFLSVFFWFLLKSLPIEWGDWQIIAFFGGIAGSLILTWLLFPIAMTVIMGFYEDRVAAIVEDNSYPHLQWKRREVSFGEMLNQSLAFLLTALLANLLALPLFLLTWVLTPFYPVVFYGLNGYLLGREYFVTIALRHLEPAEAKALWRRHLGQISLAGALIAFLLTIPVLNLVASVVAISYMVHFFADLHRSEKRI